MAVLFFSYFSVFFLYGSKHNKTGIPDRVDIDKRPKSASDRRRIGDFEADTMIGKNQKGAILTP